MYYKGWDSADKSDLLAGWYKNKLPVDKLRLILLDMVVCYPVEQSHK